MNRAGFGVRVINFVVDTLLMIGCAYGVSSWYTFHEMYWNYTYIPSYYFFWITWFIYYALFEAIFKRSPAKWLTLTKVVNNTGVKPAFWQILVRSIIRLTIIDSFFIPFFDKPLHDYLSKTEVVEV